MQQLAAAKAMQAVPAEPTFEQQVQQGARFRFGDNWREFLAVLDERRIREAETSLLGMLERDDLHGASFLDAGSGSGLFSLAARRLGARVRSFDFDPSSVWCTRALRERFFPGDPDWTVEEASVLDEAFVRSLGRFDVVYSWGVLHHTGAMWKALGLVAPLVDDGGQLFISIYNDQGRWSVWWRAIKKAYCRSPAFLKPFVLYPAALKLWGPRLVKDFVRLRPSTRWKEYYRGRGMSPWRDVVDWVGGYPFEVATPEQIFDFYRERGFTLRRLRTVGASLGTNQFVFARTGASGQDA
jgi:2-polyprenyl-6-hydroxyphenyl methylase/3-demethylubiquinone-9 3-methyltransferase